MAFIILGKQGDGIHSSDISMSQAGHVLVLAPRSAYNHHKQYTNSAETHSEYQEELTSKISVVVYHSKVVTT